MEHRTLIAAASLATVLAGAVAITTPASSAAPMASSPAAARAVATQPATTTAWLYRTEADWVRMHTRPSASSTTKALARKFDGSGIVPQRAPQNNGFTLFTDRQNGVTGWVSTSYIEELFCINNDCE